MMSSRPSYPFSNIQIFQNPKLLESLIPLVTTDPMPNVMTFATGIPSHTKIIKDLNDSLKKLHNMSSKVDNLYVGLKKVVTDRIEEKMASNGHLSADALGRRMDEFHNSWEISLDIKLSDFN